MLVACWLFISFSSMMLCFGCVLAVGWLPATISLLIVIITKLSYHSLSAHLANGLVLDSKVFSDEGSYVNK